MKTKTNVKAGGPNVRNHNQGLKVKTNIKAGLRYTGVNHNQKLVLKKDTTKTLAIKTTVKAGAPQLSLHNHNQRLC